MGDKYPASAPDAMGARTDAISEAANAALLTPLHAPYHKKRVVAQRCAGLKPGPEFPFKPTVPFYTLLASTA